MEAIDELSFEQAVAELEDVVQRLESEGLSLGEAETLYERGRALSGHCQRLLEATSLRVEQLVQGDDAGSVVPFTREVDR